ncbi:sulfite reductase subunit alpha [Variovorax sp. UMC13]|uniref:sulfite reductase subunit alpha n=1 Tax=Variovorax sp. UMC13 TaxID=1862326 RepID=UPI001602B3B7|nr:sulfite reductase subunit alpha [Variovorax sp. UMC13]
MTEPLVRALAAGLMLLAYAAMCLAIWRRERRRRAADARAASALAGDGQQPPVLVLFASQTGQAEAIAWQTGRALHAQGTPARVMSLNDLDAPTLHAAQQALFVASTYGEGDAPDGASLFTETLMGTAPALPALRYALLALGDRQYAHFCGFARALDDWLQSCGAVPLAPRIEVDNGDPAALAEWHAQWGGGALEATEDEAFAPWQLVSRTLLNAGSEGGPVFHLGLRPPAGVAMQWQSGDLAQVALADDPGRPRDYSIASLAADGELQLLVRQECHPDGTLGKASGLLTSTLALGDSVALRVRAHRNFRLDDNAGRPLILIGNGTGLAGLRSHLRARARAGQHDNWLLFGERQAAHDQLYRDELDAWKSEGVLQRLDRVFSRDQAERLYVQHRLLQASDAVQAWLARGAAVYVCGSLQGMAGGVDAALRQIAGDATVRELTASGRYRRDVY